MEEESERAPTMGNRYAESCPFSCPYAIEMKNWLLLVYSPMCRCVSEGESARHSLFRLGLHCCACFRPDVVERFSTIRRASAGGSLSRRMLSVLFSPFIELRFFSSRSSIERIFSLGVRFFLSGKALWMLHHVYCFPIRAASSTVIGGRET